MARHQKTTVYLDEDAYRVLKQIARNQGKAPASVVREAVAEYNVRHAPRRQARSVGAFKSGRHDLSERAEELLSGLGKDE